MTLNYKLRAWNKVKNEMEQSAYGELLIQQSGSVCIQQDDNTLADVSHDYDVMQFTGLLDKNGKEIYSCDIVKHHNTILVVEWIDDYACFSFTDKEVDTQHYLQKIDSPNLEIIGNIYETPHLLTTDNTTKV